MEIDRATIKALSAETRLKILKTLAKQKKMPSELSREIGISPSTVVGHLQNLESAGLVMRVETGHKWVYYTPTDKGRYLIQPRVPLQLALTLVVGVLVSLFGFLKYYLENISAGVQQSAASAKIAEPLETVPQAAGSASDSVMSTAMQAPPDFSWVYVLLIILGIAIAAFAIYKIKRMKTD